MMDTVELQTLAWIDRALDDLFALTALGRTLVQAHKDRKPFPETSLNEVDHLCYYYCEDAYEIAKHYSQALRMRTVALENSNFQWYCASTYALCHDWGIVSDSIPWIRWGGETASDSILRAITILVATFEPFAEDTLLKSVSVLRPESAEFELERATKKGLVVRVGETFRRGPRCPTPTKSL